MNAKLEAALNKDSAMNNKTYADLIKDHDYGWEIEPNLDELTKYILEEDNLVHKYTKKKPNALLSDQDWYDVAEMSDNIQQAEKFNTRAQAEQRIMSSCLENCITYGIEE